MFGTMRGRMSSSLRMPFFDSITWYLIAECVQLASVWVFLGVSRERRLHLAAESSLADRLDHPVTHDAEGVWKTSLTESKETA